MTTRHLIAYGLIAAMVAVGLAGLWFGVLRQRMAARRNHRRGKRAGRARRDALAAPTD